ncbi:MAG: PAS domain S-box protein [Balneolaceae bacterium]|nr:PAS domain S-box protein [Balneolaceae bacterium]MCH8548630.1 PAS domain S-box protein [Balneolaceae bacterium]
MKKPDLPKNENERLQEIHSYDILDTEEHKDFDFLTRMAANICGAKISLISLVTEDKQWFLSHHGLGDRETPRNFAFCAHAINTPKEPFIVEDATKDERFADNPLVTGKPNVIFYAGIPLVNENDAALGSICVIDDAPRTISNEQLKSLRLLADQAIKLLELRRKNKQLSEKKKDLDKKSELLQVTLSMNKIGVWELDLDTGVTTWSDEVYHIHEVDKDFDHNKINGIEFYHPEDRSLITEAIDHAVKTGERFDVTARFITAKNTRKWVRSTGQLFQSEDGKTTLIGSFQDITELKESEQKFQGIFNSTFSFIGFLNPDGVLLDANETALKMAGLTREDVIGKKFWDCYWWQISEKTQNELKKNIKKALHGEEVTYEVDVWIKDKKPITILFSLRPVFDERGMVSYIIPEGRPIQEIVESRNRYRSVIEGTQAGTYEWNIETNEVVINDRYAEMLGYTVEELEPVTFEKWLKNVHPKDLEKAQNLIKKCFKKEEDNFQLEMRLKHKSGDWVWVNVRGRIFEWSPSGKALKMYGTHQEITQRKNIEKKLKDERSLLRTIIDSSPDSIYVKDLQGRKVIANKVDCNYCGVDSEEELIGKSDFDLYPEEIANYTYQDDQRVFTNGESLLNREEFVFGDEGDKIWLLTSKYPFYDQDGQITGLVGIGRDITKRKKAEQTREELLKRFERIGRQIPGVIYQFKLLPDGSSCFPYASSGIKYIYGVTPEQVQTDASLAFEAIHPDDLEEVRLSIQESANNLTHWNHTYRVNLPNETIWVEGNATPQKQDDGSIIWHGFIQNITERKKAENELLYNQNLLEALYDLSPIGIALNDYENGTFIDVNDKLLEPTGYTKEEFFKLSYYDVTPKEYMEGEEEALKNMEKTGRYGPFEKEYIRKDGSRYPVLLNGVVVKDLNGRKLIWSFIEDISVKKEAERKLQEAVNSLQAILDASTQVSIIATDTEGTITHFNKGAEKMLGYSTEEVVGKHTPQLIHLDDEIVQRGKSLSEKMGREIRGFDVFTEEAKHGDATTTKWMYKRKDGSTYPILLSVTAILRENEIIGYLGVAADITPLEKAKKELDLLLNISQKQNERLKNFAHIVTHNLRSHSGAFYGLLEVIHIKNPEIYENEYIQLLKNNAISLQESIDNLTEIVKQSFAEEDDYREVNLKNAIDRNRNSLITLANKNNVKIINEVDESVNLNSIPAYLDSLIVNFLTNAIKYCDPQKDSFVRVFTDTSDTDYTIIAFEDNGIGIDLEKYGDKLFGMYNTFHEHEDSRGVGLFITKNQIESMGGRVEVKSEVGEGTTFKVYLPNSAK